MITCRILPSGNLLVTASNTARQELADCIARGYDYWTIFADAFENYSCNGSFTPFDAGNGNPFVGLTSAPCIAESMMHHGDELVPDGDVWWFPDYMIRDPLEELKNHGRTVFQLAA